MMYQSVDWIYKIERRTVGDSLYCKYYILFRQNTIMGFIFTWIFGWQKYNRAFNSWISAKELIDSCINAHNGLLV
jgi:hypothetical protein